MSVVVDVPSFGRVLWNDRGMRVEPSIDLSDEGGARFRRLVYAAVGRRPGKAPTGEPDVEARAVLDAFPRATAYGLDAQTPRMHEGAVSHASRRRSRPDTVKR